MPFPLNFPPGTLDPTNFYRFDNTLNDEQIEWVMNQVNANYQIDGTAGGSVDPDLRKQKIQWIALDKESHWLYARVAANIVNANNMMWKFDLDAMHEDFQLGVYHAEEGGHYDWHLDIGSSAANRKISAVIQLNDGFEGGDLLFQTGAVPFSAGLKKGSMVCFPSYFLHKVTPVTKGSRYSLVLWASGARFK